MTLLRNAIIYGVFETQFGEIFLACTERGLCWLGFEVGQGDNKAYRGASLARLKALYPDHVLKHHNAPLLGFKKQVLEAWARDDLRSVALDMKGTAFQQDVWRALLEIPKGELRSYQDIANAVGRPKAVRAVGSAIGANPVSLIVPCHRVVRTGAGDYQKRLGGYAWGLDVKRAILEAEMPSIAA